MREIKRGNGNKNTFVHLGSNKWHRLSQKEEVSTDQTLIKQMVIAFVFATSATLLPVWVMM